MLRLQSLSIAFFCLDNLLTILEFLLIDWLRFVTRNFSWFLLLSLLLNFFDFVNYLIHIIVNLLILFALVLIINRRISASFVLYGHLGNSRGILLHVGTWLNLSLVGPWWNIVDLIMWSSNNIPIQICLCCTFYFYRTVSSLIKALLSLGKRLLCWHVRLDRILCRIAINCMLILLNLIARTDSFRLVLFIHHGWLYTLVWWSIKFIELDIE